MPTGPEHTRAVNRISGGELTQETSPCRCTIGEDHIDGPMPIETYDEDAGESFAGAEEIFDSSGQDEEYDFR